MTIWGPRHAALASHPQVRTLPLIRDYDTFFTKFSAGQFDIGLAPLPDDEFHRGKSNNKFREYASCGIAGVYSDMSVYNTSVQHEITGLLVPNEDAAWEAAIERLIVDAKLREGIAERARAYARAHFNETDDRYRVDGCDFNRGSAGAACACCGRRQRVGGEGCRPRAIRRPARHEDRAGVSRARIGHGD